MEDESRRFEESLVDPFGHTTPFSIKASEMPSYSIVMSSSSQAARGNTTLSSEPVIIADSSSPLPSVGVDQSYNISPRFINKPPLYPYYPERRQSISELNQVIEKELIFNNDSTSDHIKLRRTASNRISAQRSRMKKARYVDGLEKKAKELETFIATLRSEIELHTSMQEPLLSENAALRQHIHDFTAISNLGNIQMKANKQEVERLIELFKKQTEEMMYEQDSNMGIQQEMSMQGSSSHHPRQQRSAVTSSYDQFQESNHETDIDAEMVDQYINFDAINL